MESEQNVPDGLSDQAAAAAAAHADAAPDVAHLPTHDRVDDAAVVAIGERWTPQGDAAEQEA